MAVITLSMFGFGVYHMYSVEGITFMVGSIMPCMIWISVQDKITAIQVQMQLNADFMGYIRGGMKGMDKETRRHMLAQLQFELENNTREA